MPSIQIKHHVMHHNSERGQPPAPIHEIRRRASSSRLRCCFLWCSARLHSSSLHVDGDAGVYLFSPHSLVNILQTDCAKNWRR
eukprot:scaffold8208_cov141-Skeletonema_marinoi.AAC.7